MNMKTILATMIAGLLLPGWSNGPGFATTVIGKGEQPQVATGEHGWIRIVFGRKDSIFCAVSMNQGITFPKPAFVARVQDMHLGMSRGPQIASSANYTVITAMDKAGDIHWFRYGHSSHEWKNMGILNDMQGSAPEGLMGIAADDDNHFYAVWLDTRKGKRNEVYFSSLSGKSKQWTKNILVYQSPDGHVCECCKPSVAVRGSEVVVMFRNWLSGSRDLYLLRSLDRGGSFTDAQKLGAGTWKLNGCPMDGGAVVVDPSRTVHTVWQREGYVYYCRPGETEMAVGKGRTCSIVGTAGNPVITMQKGDTLEAIKLPQREVIQIGTGSFVKPLALPGNNMLFVWEQDGLIKYKRV